MTTVNSKPIILNYKNTNTGSGMSLVNKTPRSAEGPKHNRPRPTPINVAKANEGQFYSPDKVRSPGRAALVAGLRSATDRRHTQRNGSPIDMTQFSPRSSDFDEHQQRLQTLQDQHSYEQKRLWIQQQQELFHLQQQLLTGGPRSAGEPRPEYQNYSLPSPPQTPGATNRPPRLLSQKQQEILAASNLLAQKQLNLRSVFTQQNIGTSTTNSSVYQPGLPSPKFDSNINADDSFSYNSVPNTTSSGKKGNVRKIGTVSAATTPKTPTFSFNNSPRYRQQPTQSTIFQGQFQQSGRELSDLAVKPRTVSFV